jgi:hypothetical protein
MFFCLCLQEILEVARLWLEVHGNNGSPPAGIVG